jgi:transcriptional regulator with XRE-family HTH domain
MEPETERILENLRKMRTSQNISLLKLANMVEISHSHLYYIESKRVIPSIDVIIKLAKALNLNLVNLLEYETVQANSPNIEFPKKSN